MSILNNDVLVNAIRKDDDNALDHLLRHIDPNSTTKGGEPLLMLASAHGSHAAAKRLLAAGADVNMPSPAGETAIFWLEFRPDDLKMLDLLIKAGADLNQKTVFGETPLMRISRAAGTTPEMIRRMVASGADVNAEAPDGLTAVLAATCYGNTGVLDALLSAGARPNQSNPLALPPLVVAVEDGMRDKALRLIEAGANVNSSNPDNGQTPLMLAVAADDKALVRVLLDAEADVGAKDRLGNSALEIARQKSDGVMIELLESASEQGGAAQKPNASLSNDEIYQYEMEPPHG